jgi:hypothetical protein
MKILTVVLLISLGGCALVKPTCHAIAESPDGSRRVVIEKICAFGGCKFSIELECGGDTVTIFRGEPERYPMATEVAWSRSMVAVFVHDGINQSVLVGYEFESEKTVLAELDGESIQGYMVSQAIKQRYGLTSTDLEPFDGNAIAWLSSYDSHDAVAKYIKDGPGGPFMQLPPIVVGGGQAEESR